MCGGCLPSLSRRRALGLLAGVAVTARLPRSVVSASTLAPVPVAAGLEILPREAWADGREPTGPLAPELDVRFLLVHHTASANGDDPVKVMRSAYDFHTGPEKGWPDVCYNFFIDQFGVIWEARQGSLAGPIEASATGGSQGFAQLVCLLGDFTSELPTDAALASLNRTLAWLAVRSKIVTTPGTTTQFVSRGSNRWPEGSTVTAATISGHRDMSETACPGDIFYPYLVANVPAQVTELIGASTPSTTAVPPSTLPPPTSAPTTTSTTVVTTEPAPLPTTAPADEAPTSIATAQVAETSSPPSTDGGDGSRTDIGTAALVVLGGGALAGAALLAHRHQRSNTSDPEPDEKPGAGS